MSQNSEQMTVNSGMINKLSNAEISRYSRQLILPELGVKGKMLCCCFCCFFVVGGGDKFRILRQYLFNMLHTPGLQIRVCTENYCFLISQPKHMLWVLKRTISTR